MPQELHGPRKQPRRMDGRNRKDRQKQQCTGTPAKLLCEWLHVVGRADFDLFVRFENTASCRNARRHAGSRQLLSACLRCRFLIGAYLLCRLCGLVALCCPLLRCACGAKKAKKFRKVPPHKKCSRRQLRAEKG